MSFRPGDKVIYKGSIEYVVSEAHVDSSGNWYTINPIDNPRLPMNLVVDEDQIKHYSDVKAELRNNAIDKLLKDV